MAFAAAVVPLLSVDRMQALGFTYESIVLTGAGLYFAIRFGLAKVLAKYTVHRGMFHSIPAALTFAGLAFLLTGCTDLNIRYYKAGAVLLGYMSHLVLDEIFSVDVSRGRIRLKRSFGTALKWWGKSLWANVSTYAKLILVASAILGEPAVMERYGTEPLVAIHSEWADTIRSRIAHDHDDDAAQRDKTIYDTAKRLSDLVRWW
jgi:hypothetical protein